MEDKYLRFLFLYPVANSVVASVAREQFGRSQIFKLFALSVYWKPRLCNLL